MLGEVLFLLRILFFSFFIFRDDYVIVCVFCFFFVEDFVVLVGGRVYIGKSLGI